MTAHAYILVNVHPAQTQQVVQRLRSIKGATVNEVLGPYDMVVELEAESAEYLTTTLRDKIRPVPGVVSTVTCVWIEDAHRGNTGGQ